MTDPETQARNRYFVIAGVNLVASAGSVFGLILAAKSRGWGIEILGGAIVLSGLYVMAVVPKSLAHRWRTPE